MCERFCECMLTHGELMVDFVDVFVDPAMMQQPMQEVVPGVFNHSAAKTLSQNIWPEEGDQKRKSAPGLVLVQPRCKWGCSNRHQRGQQNWWNWPERVTLSMDRCPPHWRDVLNDWSSWCSWSLSFTECWNCLPRRQALNCFTVPAVVTSHSCSLFLKSASCIKTKEDTNLEIFSIHQFKKDENCLS